MSAFLGGLWKVSVEASALLMTFLFEELATAGGSKSLAGCWRNAQIRLYGLTTKDAVAVLENPERLWVCFQTWMDHGRTRSEAAKLVANNHWRY